MTFEAIEDLNRPITTRTECLTEKSFDGFWLGYRLRGLLRADGERVFIFEDVEEGGSYRAVTEYDYYKNRCYINDQVLVVEAAHYLADILRPTCSNVRIDLSLTVYAGEDKHTSPIKMVGEYFTHFDAIVHGDVAGKAFAIVLAASTHVHQELHFGPTLNKAMLFKHFIASPSPIYCDAGYKIPRVPFKYNNVTTVVPCLAGRFFPPELLEACKSKGIIPIYPTGAHFTADNIHILYDLLASKWHV